MLIATFGPSTAWVGMQVTREGDAFVLEGHGPISAGDIMEYDRQGHLVWVDAGTRAWVGSKSKGSRVSNAAAASAAAAPTTSEARSAAGVKVQSSSHKPRYLKRALLLAIIVLVVANVVLMLIISGAVRGP